METTTPSPAPAEQQTPDTTDTQLAPAPRQPTESAEIDKLAAALAKAQGIIHAAKNDRDVEIIMRSGQKYAYSYATLASVMDACREPLSANGIAVIQRPSQNGRGSLTVETRLVHESGQWISGRLTLPVDEFNPKGIGSVISYARRYLLSSLVGIATEDDDGEAASESVKGSQRQETESIRPKGAAAAPRVSAPKKAPEPTPEQKARSAKTSAIWRKAQEAGIKAETFTAWRRGLLGGEKPNDQLTDDDVAHMEAALPELLSSAAGDVPH